jgi:hypothetical protein
LLLLPFLFIRVTFTLPSFLLPPFKNHPTFLPPPKGTVSFSSYPLSPSSPSLPPSIPPPPPPNC